MTQQGINLTRPILLDLTPALNIILTKVPNPVYSGYKGIIAETYGILLEVFRTIKVKTEYSLTIWYQIFPFRQTTLPSPIFYLRSYILTDYKKQSIIAPLLFIAQLCKDHIEKYIQEAQKSVTRPNCRDGDSDENNKDEQTVYKVDLILINAVTRVLAAIIQSNSILIDTQDI